MTARARSHPTFVRPAARGPALLATLALGLPALAQDKDEKPPAVDTITDADPKAMEALGVVAYGSMIWSKFRTDDIDRVLGEGRILWMETEHFRIGSTLKTATWPDDSVARKEVQAETARLNKRYKKIKKRPKDFPPWLLMHLYAQRVEEIYADIADLVGSEDGTLPEGPYLGLKDKFLLLLFEKKSDLARYADRFCGREADRMLRHSYWETRQQVVAVSAEDDPPRQDPDMHSQVRYLVSSAILDGLYGRVGTMPPWLRLGLAHHYERQVTSRLISVNIHDDETVDRATQHEWPEKVRARIQHEKLVIPFTELVAMNDLGYYANLQSWSRIDYLLQRDRSQLGAFLSACKLKPQPESQLNALQEVFGLDPETFDTEWRAWVLKTYK